MTSYTSANTAPNPLKSAFVYLAASLFCAFFGAVYELFSHEVYSYFMIYAFAIPLVLGALPNLVIALKGLRAPGKLAANAWNSGVAALTVGSIFKGALDIYGTTSQLALVYPVVAAILLVAGLAFHFLAAPSGARRRRPASQQPSRVVGAHLSPRASCGGGRGEVGTL